MLFSLILYVVQEYFFQYILVNVQICLEKESLLFKESILIFFFFYQGDRGVKQGWILFLSFQWVYFSEIGILVLGFLEYLNLITIRFQILVRKFYFDMLGFCLLFVLVCFIFLGFFIIFRLSYDSGLVFIYIFQVFYDFQYCECYRVYVL